MIFNDDDSFKAFIMLLNPPSCKLHSLRFKELRSEFFTIMLAILSATGLVITLDFKIKSCNNDVSSKAITTLNNPACCKLQ